MKLDPKAYACIHICLCVCMYVCMSGYVHVCMYVCMNAFMHEGMHACMYVCICWYLYECIHASAMGVMYISVYVCMHVCMYACMYVCILIDGGCKCFVICQILVNTIFCFSQADITSLRATATAAPHVNMHSRLQHPARRRRGFFQHIPTYMHAVGVFPDWSISIRNLSRLHLYNISLKKTRGGAV